MPENVVVDWKENELHVGDKVVFGAPDPGEELNHIGTITEIGEPDVRYNPATDRDDGGYGLEIKVTFDDGSVEIVKADIRSTGGYDEHSEPDAVFEACDDIELAAGKGHTHTHTIRDGKTVCVYCGEEMEL